MTAAERSIFRGERVFQRGDRQELDRYAQTVGDAFDRISFGTPTKIERLPLVVRGKTKAAYGREVPTMGQPGTTIVVELPRPDTRNGGRECAVLRYSTEDTVLLQPDGGRLNGSTEAQALTPERGLHQVYFDGHDHWTVSPGSSLVVNTIEELSRSYGGALRLVLGREQPGDGGEGEFRWISGNQSALVAIDPSRGVYVPPRFAPDGSRGVWARVWRDRAKVEWWGAKGDGVRPSDSTGMPTGTDDTAAVGAARDFLQEIAFQPNIFVGDWGGMVLEFTANKSYVLRGDNPLGTTRPRSVVTGDDGANARQNWRIDGNFAVILWIIDNEDDRFIEAHETFVRLQVKNLCMIPCNLSGAQGTFFSNVANTGRNALSLQEFEGVNVMTVGTTSAQSPIYGLKYLFYYTGTNLGDRLQTEWCRFSNFKTGFYSENLEAVSQRFTRTSFGSYMTDAVFFHLRRHGSGFSVHECELLCKGTQQTLLKTEWLPGSFNTGYGAGNDIINITQSRLECEDNLYFTMADLQFGLVEIADLSMAPGGLPAADTEAIRIKDSAVLRVRNCHLYGRIVMYAPLVTSYNISRRYQLELDGCFFSQDLGQAIYVDDGAGNLVRYRDAVVDDLERPALLVTNTTTRTIGWIGLTTDTSRYVFDGQYLGTNWPNLTHRENTVTAARYRTSSQRWYLDDEEYFVLPPCCTITSIRLTRPGIAATHADQLDIIIGSATYTVWLDNEGRVREEVLAPHRIVISDDDKAERTLSLALYLAGVAVGSPSVQGWIDITYRQALGLNEIDTTEVAGVRLTRVVTDPSYRESVSENVATAGTTANMDITIQAATRQLWRIDVMAEDAAGSRASRRILAEAYRSGSNNVALAAATTEHTAGAGITVNVSAVGTATLRVSTSNGFGNDCHVTTRAQRVDCFATVEDS